MERSRRNFLKASGLAALGLGALPVMRLHAAEEGELPMFMQREESLKAKQWAMVVDMKKCWEDHPDGCTDCMLACHKVHNVPDIGTIKEEIKWIWTEEYEHTFPDQSHELIPEEIRHHEFIVLCNHCTKPPCCRVCPTQATFKRDDNGIVMMDFHRCIGCRYCMAGCPYGARSFNFRDPRPFIQQVNKEFPTRERGVVEKCNFCAERLAVGKIPACVEACKSKALVFGDVADPESPVRKILDSRYTIRRKISMGTQPNIYYVI